MAKKISNQDLCKRIVAIENGLKELEEEHHPRYETVSAHRALEKQIDGTVADVWKVKERLCMLETNDTSKDDVVKEIVEVIVTHIGERVDELEKYVPLKIRKLIDASYKKAIQHTNKMHCIHDREEHLKSTPKENETTLIKVRRIKSSLACAMNSFPYFKRRANFFEKTNIEYMLEDCLNLLDQVEKDIEGDEEFNFDPTDC